MIYDNETVTFNMKIKPCILMDQSGARCMHVKQSMVWSLSCDLNMGKNQSDCTNCLKCLRISFFLFFMTQLYYNYIANYQI